MVPEASFTKTDEGLVPTTPGWFVLNARDARWFHRPGRGDSCAFTGRSDEEVMAMFPQLGVNLLVLQPGEPMAMYHWEADAEGFLVLSGEALAILEGTERPLVQWDYVHCPPDAGRVIIGAGDGPCVVLAIGARENQMGAWGGYRPDEVAARHGVSVAEETDDARIAYARFATPEPAPYREGLLPGG